MFFSGCISFQKQPGPGETMEEIPPEPELSWEILDYRNKASGGTIPQWLSSYLEGGIASVERLGEFQNYYVFVSVNSGTNYNALEQWNAGFSPDLDFPRLVAMRIEKRFLDAATTYPDDAYGGYYIALIRSASDALWRGAVRDSDFWLHRSFVDANDVEGLEAIRESYDYFVLVKAEKKILTPQITELLKSIKPETALSSDQAAAVKQVQDRFFERF